MLLPGTDFAFRVMQSNISYEIYGGKVIFVREKLGHTDFLWP